MLMNSIGHEKGSAPHCLTLSQSSGRITRTALGRNLMSFRSPLRYTQIEQRAHYTHRMGRNLYRN